MRAYRQIKTIFSLAGAALLLMACAATAVAQFPPPAAIPPAPAIVPAAQTIATGFEMTGFIQYASVDQLCVPNSNPPAPDGCKTAGGAQRFCRAHGFVRNLRQGFYRLGAVSQDANDSICPQWIRAWESLTAQLLGA